MHKVRERAAVAVLLLSAAPIGAQGIKTSSWREVFDYGFRDIEVLGRVERADIASAPSFDRIHGRCEVGAPDSVVLIGRTKYSRGEQEWLPSFTAFYLDSDREGPMKRVGAPSAPDTLKVRVARTICGVDGQLNSFVLEHAGRFVHMDLPSPLQLGMVWIFAEGADGHRFELRWSPVLKRIEDVSRARARWTAAAWRQLAITWVLSGNIYVGMTPEMVRESWGEPKTINQTTTAHAHSEQWVYGSRSYVYLRNGKVYAIQQ